MMRFPVTTLALLLPVFALAGAAGGARPTLQVGPQTRVHACENGRDLRVHYVTIRSETGQTLVVVLEHQERLHSLLPAVSASGARFLGHPTPGRPALEWWEHQGQGTLSAVATEDPTVTTPLLRCRLQV